MKFFKKFVDFIDEHLYIVGGLLLIGIVIGASSLMYEPKHIVKNSLNGNVLQKQLESYGIK